MLTVALALAGALVYGVADFLGGFASRRARAVTVAAWAAVAGLVPLGIGLAVFGGTFSSGAILWGTVAGVSGSIGVLLLYAALAVGPMSVLSPLTAVVAAAVPVLATLLSGTALSPLKIASLVVALVSVILVSTSREKSSQPLTRRGLLAALIAGCGFGGLVIAYDQAPVAGMATLLIARLIQVLLMLLAACVVFIWIRRARAGLPDEQLAIRSQRSQSSPRQRWRFAALVVTCGILDAGANVLIQTALQATDSPTSLAIVGVLNSLYPLGTVLLAWVILRERLIRMQILGLALALAASAGLALS
jgi:drug/metabolite transporter (DMT)-like permease